MATKSVKVDDLDKKTEGTEAAVVLLNGGFFKLGLGAASPC